MNRADVLSHALKCKELWGFSPTELEPASECSTAASTTMAGCDIGRTLEVQHEKEMRKDIQKHDEEKSRIIRRLLTFLTDMVRAIKISIVLSPASISLPIVWMAGSSTCWRSVM